MSFTFVHAADIHLDSPLRGLSQYDSAPVDELRSATRQAFMNLVTFCIDRPVDFLLLAGDLYDGDWKDYNTGLFFLNQMARLKAAGIPVFIVRGNHDAENGMTKSLRPLDNMHVFSWKKPEMKPLEALNVAIHGQSYGDKVANDDLSANYLKPVPGAFNIGLLHTSADGRSTEHAKYAPCAIQTLVDKGYDYWALGHVHKREVIRTDPYIVFPGNLQGRHIRETGPKGATIVEVKNGQVSVEHRDFDFVRWHLCDVPIHTLRTPDQAMDHVSQTLAVLRTQTRELPLAVRVRLMGDSDAHAGLIGNPERWINEVRVRGAELGNIWVEKVLFETRAPIDLDALRQRPDPLGELLRTIESCRNDEAALASLLAELKPLQEKLPGEAGDGSDVLCLDQPDVVQRLLDDVEQLLIPQLIESEEAQ